MSVIKFKEANCKNCYKCIRSCPIKAISFKNEQAQILEDECVLCGRCLTVCPQNAKSVKSEIDRVKDFINSGEKVYVSIAPSFVSAFDCDNPKKVFIVLKKLGFTHIEETAIGAARVSKEYGKLIRDKKMTNIITSSCPTINFLIEKHFPELVDCLAPVVSPMIAHAKMLRAAHGRNIKVVFIGPCISKKEECNDLQNEGEVDAVITFEELDKWMKEENIDFDFRIDEELNGISNLTSRFYPAPGGIIRTLKSEEKANYKCISIDGIDRCIDVLNCIKKSSVNNYFIEMSSCDGGCMGGPCIKKNIGGILEAKDRLEDYYKQNIENAPVSDMEYIEVKLDKKFIDKSKKYDIPDEKIIREILSKIGKFSKEQELNCGACGYHTCRDKAIAVYNNKADLHMCMPYMHERAESFSNVYIHSTPNGIIALNENLCIQEYNRAAQEMFGFAQKDMNGINIYELLDCPDFIDVKEKRQDVVDKKYYYKKFDLFVEQSILYIKEHQMIVAIIKDITQQTKQQERMNKMRSQTVDIAQNVIEKQMRVAQEIASLLGETTAETKVALTKLKKSILSNEGELK